MVLLRIIWHPLLPLGMSMSFSLGFQILFSCTPFLGVSQWPCLGWGGGRGKSMGGGRTHTCITWSRGLWGGLEGGQGTESTETLLWICSILLPGVLLQFWSHRLHLQSVTLKFFRDRSFRPHFEHSENPFYDVQHYKVFACPKWKCPKCCLRVMANSAENK